MEGVEEISIDTLIDNIHDYYDNISKFGRVNYTPGSFLNFEAYLFSIYKKKVFSSNELKKNYYAIKNDWSYVNDRIAYQSDDLKRKIGLLFKRLQ